mmetsp:Transcript_8360/g.14087  ORF Transcript_8360/g.14087 Transcript_8360/m.14087 type:complete len:1240 (+) Transcript_8360:71-3790(+)
MCTVLPLPRVGAPRRARSCGAAVEGNTLPPLVEPHLPATGQRSSSLGPAAGRGVKRHATAAPTGARISGLLEDHLPPISGAMPQASALPKQNGPAPVQPVLKGGAVRSGRPPSADKTPASSKASGVAGHAQARPQRVSGKRPPGGAPPLAPGPGRPPSGGDSGLPGNSSHAGATANGCAPQKAAGRRSASQSAAQTGAAMALKSGKTGASDASIGTAGVPRTKSFPERKATVEQTEPAKENKQRPAESSMNARAAAARAAAHSVLDEARDFMSDDLRRVVEEETVTYSWRRKSDADKKQDVERKKASSESPTVEQQRQGKHSPANESTADAPRPDAGSPPGTSPEGSTARPSSKGSKGGSPNRPPSMGKGATIAEPKAKTAQSAKFAMGKPPRPQADSFALVPAKLGARKPTSTPAGSRPNTAGRVDISQAAHARAERLSLCSAAVEFGVKLVTYDGSVPYLKGSFLSGVYQDALRQWAHGGISGELACLYVDDWAQGEVLLTEEPGGVLVQQLGILAGMLADASLQRSSTAELHGNVFGMPPGELAKSAAQAIIDATHPEDGSILVSEVESELSMLEACASGQGSAGKLRVAVQRELLRLFWAGSGTSPVVMDSGADDTWLLRELKQSPESVESRARAAGVEVLQRENRLLDAYLLRLLRLKRALSLLLDKWEKVDHYAVLGLTPTCSDKELKSAYRKKCLQLHPDKGGDKVQFQQLQDAYARILEERAKQTPSAQPSSAAAAASGGNTTSAAPRAAPRKPQDGSLLALEGPEGGSTGGAPGGPSSSVPAAAAEVVAALQQMLQHVEVVENHMQQAKKADEKVQQLRQAKTEQEGGAVEALHAAQEAGEMLLQLSEEIGKLGPSLSETAMEVAECSLVLAARFAAVPAALLLTDVALSCTFEASRMQHSAKQLLEVRSDTITTLQTLKTNLQMAKIIGTVDAETLKLSLGLVGKAAKRLIASLRQVASAVADAAQRGRQCSTHAKSIAAFAEGRSEAEEAFADDDFGPQAALPAPDEAYRPESESTFSEPPSADKQPGSPPSAKKPPPPDTSQRDDVNANAARPQRANAVLESRLQNDRLLRQLNSDLLDLQHRARSHLAKNGATLLANITTEARSQALQLVAEILLTAAELAKTDVSSIVAGGSNADDLDACLARHFDFVEACSCGLAMTMDLRTQLLRLGALLDSQAVICALEKGVKPRLAACCEALGDDKRAPLLAVLDRRFDLLCSSVVAMRMA